MDALEHALVEGDPPDLLELLVEERVELLDEAVAEAEGTGGELVGHRGVHVRVVVLVIGQTTLELIAQHPGQVLLVGDLLEDRPHNLPRLVEDPLLIPVGVDPLEGGGDPVMVPKEECVESGQSHEDVGPVVSRDDIHIGI